MRVALAQTYRERAAKLARALLLVLFALAAPFDAAAQRGGNGNGAAGAPPAGVSPERRTTPRPAPLADYRARVGEAVAPLEELASLYERARKGQGPGDSSGEGSNSDSVLELPKREESALGKVRALLPPSERVERGGGAFVDVDNSWLHAALDESRRADDYEKRAALLRAAAGRLRALEAQLGEGEAQPRDKDAERGRLNSILRDPAFNREAKQPGGALERLLEALLEWLSRLFGGSRNGVVPGASPGATRLAQIVVLALCLAVLAYVARRLWARRGARPLKLKREARVVLGERLEPDATSGGLLEDAERLARSGDLRGAIRKAYVALLVELGDRGLIRLARHKTNRDYLNAVRLAASPHLYTEMLPLTFDFELHWYGFREASDADWENFKTRCRAVLKQSVV